MTTKQPAKYCPKVYKGNNPSDDMKIPKFYFDVKERGEVRLKEFPKGKESKKMFDKLLSNMEKSALNKIVLKPKGKLKIQKEVRRQWNTKK